MNRNILRFTLALCAVALTSCDQAFQSNAERKFAQAEKKFAQQSYAEAVPLYEAALDGTPNTADIHFKLGLLYDDQIKAPISAMHHFQRYLDLAPSGQHAKEARKFLRQDKLALSAALGNGATVTQEEAKRLKNTNFELQKKILQLKSDLEESNKARSAAYKAMGGKAGLPKMEQVQKPLVEGVRTYTVQPGDTLASIARKFYKNNHARWKEIQNANFGPMEGTAKLKPGMVLMVP